MKDIALECLNCGKVFQFMGAHQCPECGSGALHEVEIDG